MAAAKKPTTTRRKAGGRRKGEVVLLTCSPLISEETMKQLASVCLGKIFEEDTDGYQRVIGVRVDASSHAIYAKLEPTIESAYIFAPAHFFAEVEKKPAHVIKVHFHLRVENNNKYIRMKSKVRTRIEESILSHYQMEKPRAEGWDYTLTISYEDEEELTRIITEEIVIEAARLADLYNCFIETDVTALDGSERSW